jgi:diguanylate cyclase (GGDEF)-like protein
VQTKEKFSVLLVDDDPMVIRILSRILSDFAPLRFATTGQAALKLARESVPDLVMLDVEMPDFNGFEICKAFKADPVLATVPIIFVTSHESPELETAGMKLGAADFISKPPHASLVLARVRTYQQLKSLSDTVRSAVTLDFLTGTATRRRMEKVLTEEWLRAQRSPAPLSLLLVNIDNFAALNAAHGEECGDLCLRAVAEALRPVAQRPTDILARHGGGCFALLLPGTSCQGAAALAGRAVRAVDAIVVPGERGPLRLTVSVGGAHHLFPRPAGGPPVADAVPGDLVAAAEHALDRAKSDGGNRADVVDLLRGAAGPIARRSVH